MSRSTWTRRSPTAVAEAASQREITASPRVDFPVHFTTPETYTLWLEEANMEDWKVPGSYSGLQERLARIDKLKGGIKRIKPDRR